MREYSKQSTLHTVFGALGRLQLEFRSHDRLLLSLKSSGVEVREALRDEGSWWLASWVLASGRSWQKAGSEGAAAVSADANGPHPLC